MRVQNNTIPMFLNIMFVLLLIITPTDVFAACDHQPDAPDCLACFVDTADWHPMGDFIQDIAIQTVGTVESCECLGTLGCNWQFPEGQNEPGKPYYQMVLGCNSAACAVLVSQRISRGVKYDRREAWCSETVSYWHREADIPYEGGYRRNLLMDWQKKNIGAIRMWYETEELIRNVALFSGRGTWIEPDDVNYVDFELGVTVPVPGAYVAIVGYDPNRGFDPNKGTHSLMVNEMWIHKDAAGNVFRVGVSLLEGNNEDSKVDDRRRWDDILSLTPQGGELINNNSKIWGFGIDLDSTEQPIYDPARLHVVNWPLVHEPPQTTDVEPNDPVWEHYYAPQIPKLVTYAQLLFTLGGEPNVTCSSTGLQISGIPDARQVYWHFPSGLTGTIEIDIDLLDVHPLLIRGIELTWDGNSVPPNYRIQYARDLTQYIEAIVPDLNDVSVPTPPVPIPVPTMFATTGNGVEVRYVKLIFENPFQQNATLQELRFRYDQGPLRDTELCRYTVVGDLDGNCRIDFSDVARMADNWLVNCLVSPLDPACVPEY